MKKIKLFIGLPVHHFIEPATEKTLEAIIYARSNVYEIVDFMKLRGSPNIYAQRNNLAKAFLRASATHFLYFDADQTLGEPQKDIELLIADDKDIISPLITRRFFPHIPACITFNRKRKLVSGRGLEELEDFRQYGNLPFKVYYSCGGVVMLKRKIVEEVKLPFYPVIDDGDLLSTDYSFYYKARQLGFSCWIEPRIICGHVGKYSFTPADYYALLDNNMIEVKKLEGGRYEYKTKS